eukprot:1140641-Pelagomonas_calceolata.AAC.2
MVGEVLAVLLRLSPKPFVLLYGGGDGEDDDGSLLASDELSWSGEWGLEKGRSSREMGHLSGRRGRTDEDKKVVWKVSEKGGAQKGRSSREMGHLCGRRGRD